MADINPPRLLVDRTPELEKLIKTFEAIHKDIETGRWHEDNDDVHYVYEAAAEALYGEDYFKWLNEVTS